MSKMLTRLRQAASDYPERIAFEGSDASLSYGALYQVITELTYDLSAQRIRALGLLANNGLPWALVDVSAMIAGIPIVPLPLFFSSQQILHAINDAGLNAILTDQPMQLESLLQDANIQFHKAGDLGGLHLIRLQGVIPQNLPHGTAKISYTSGTTGEPKGVCLSLAQIETVATSLMEASQAQFSDRHLCLTPLSTLLENIGGIYTPLLAGACSCLLPLQQVGLIGAVGLDVARMLKALHTYRASSTIFAPQMLQALVVAGEDGASMPANLRFIAVGGAPVSLELLQRARQINLPVFEGYGLSECGSVVSLNTPDAYCVGSVGRPLPHVAISFSDIGEVLVSGSNFLGYLGRESPSQHWPTGDIGYLDTEGFLHITGRRKSLFITSFGRNVAPEWIERELTMHPAIAQVAVYGEAKPFSVAVIVARLGYSKEQVDMAVQATNKVLPDYARIKSWVLAAIPFMPVNQQLTTNGRLKRDAILMVYSDALERLYQEEVNVIF
ncbi:AMP-binding protein [Sulfuriferula nivalis]|uniref:Long-chain acyl-CoA synthetase n=1 Tax=Sulfuriferula nivalis TaxID=2675298 RepID=A0A809RFK8_9PROT|nr:AMP-binding protein [Sulfuriferula nivalis]BBP00426.1 long-chain acyl-CoA synthetase [Sulfuriferula nivalis]